MDGGEVVELTRLVSVLQSSRFPPRYLDHAYLRSTRPLHVGDNVDESVIRSMAFGRRKSTGNRIGTYLSPSSSWLLPVYVFVVVLFHRSASEPATRDVYQLKSNSIQAFLELESARSSCVDKPLEVRERQADAIFSGTVRNVDPPVTGSDSLRRAAVVAVKRVIKGDRVVDGAARAHLSGSGGHRGGPGRPLVVVRGIGDPRICLSTARKYDTRIFLVRDDGHGGLVLNSSLVRLTLHNIDHTEAVVRSQ